MNYWDGDQPEGAEGCHCFSTEEGCESDYENFETVSFLSLKFDYGVFVQIPHTYQWAFGTWTYHLFEILGHKLCS